MEESIHILPKQWRAAYCSSKRELLKTLSRQELQSQKSHNLHTVVLRIDLEVVWTAGLIVDIYWNSGKTPLKIQRGHMGKEKVEHPQWLQSYYRNFCPKQINEMADTWTQPISGKKKGIEI